MKAIDYSRLRNFSLDLMDDKAKQMSAILETINYSDIDTEEKYQKVLLHELKKLLLHKIALGVPKIVSHREVEKEIQPNALNPIGGKCKVLHVDVEIPIEGSQEMLEYHPNGFQSGCQYTQVIQSDGSNFLKVTVESPSFDKGQVLKLVEDKMCLTKQFIYSHNDQVDHYNDLIISRFNTEMSRRRDNLARLYA